MRKIKYATKNFEHFRSTKHENQQVLTLKTKTSKRIPIESANTVPHVYAYKENLPLITELPQNKFVSVYIRRYIRRSKWYQTVLQTVRLCSPTARSTFVQFQTSYSALWLHLTSDNLSAWNFWNAVLKKMEDQLDRLCDNEKNITKSQKVMERPTCNEEKEG